MTEETLLYDPPNQQGLRQQLISVSRCSILATDAFHFCSSFSSFSCCNCLILIHNACICILFIAVNTVNIRICLCCVYNWLLLNKKKYVKNWNFLQIIYRYGLACNIFNCFSSVTVHTHTLTHTHLHTHTHTDMHTEASKVWKISLAVRPRPNTE